MTNADPAPQPPAIPNLTPAMWGLYLACSWTWCIGMFLPALLLRDAGWMGYAVFFLPNVIGAGAMGFVLRSPDAARRIVDGHRAMTRLFSTVTLAFHVFWFAWVSSFVRDAFPIPDTWLMGAASAAIAWVIVSGRVVRAGAAPRAALVLWLVGLAAFAGALLKPDVLTPTTQAMIAPPTHPGSAAWLMPVCVFGFLLCPYLDLTFLLARQRTEGVSGGRVAFGLGFWLFFPVMIGLTALYAGPLIAVLEGRQPPTVAPWAGAAVLFHMIAQWVFTVRVHTERLWNPSDTPQTTDDRGRVMWDDPLGVASVLILCIGAGVLGVFAPSLPAHASMSAGEIVYRVFMGAYGLVFPVYVWARMVPRRRVPTHGAWIAACVLAAPCFWMGFIERHGPWLAPGILIALVVPLLWREPAQPS